MWWNYEFHNWGMRCKLTMCHNPKRKKIGLGTHTRGPGNTDILVNGGKKWGVWSIII